MSEIKKYYWLKLHKDFFKRHDIRIIEAMPNGKEYVLFYMKLLLESIDHDGLLRFNDTIPYNDSMLSTITNTNIDIVRSAINVFKKMEMMDILDDGTLHLEQTKKMIGSETKWKDQKRDYRKRKSLKITQEELPDKYPYALGKCTVYSKEQIELPNGFDHYVDEKRYGGNGKLAIARSDGKCEKCGKQKDKTTKIVIHHNNNYSNCLDDLLVLCTDCHGTVHGQNEDMSDKSIDIELDKEKDIDKELDNKNKKETRHKHGEYKNVLLTDIQYNSLLEEWGTKKLNSMIKELDEGIQLKGYRYKDHNLAIRKWYKNSNKSASKPDQYNMDVEVGFGTTEEIYNG